MLEQEEEEAKDENVQGKEVLFAAYVLLIPHSPAHGLPTSSLSPSTARRTCYTGLHLDEIHLASPPNNYVADTTTL